MMLRADSLEKTLMLGKIEGRRRRGRQRMRRLDGITDLMDMGLGDLWELWWTGRPGVLQFLGLQRVRHHWATELNWNLWKCRERQILYDVTCMWNLENNTNECIHKTKIHLVNLVCFCFVYTNGFSLSLHGLKLSLWAFFNRSCF